MKKIYTLFCMGILLLASCEELVEVDAPNNQIGTTQVFNDLKTANSALSGLYASLRDRSVISGDNGIGTLLGTYTDDLDFCQTDQNRYTDIYLNQQQESNTAILDLWGYAYQQIYQANSIIYGTEHSTVLSDNDKNRIKSEALFVRSLNYFYLQQLFDEIPYTNSLDYEYNRNLSKTGPSALLEQLESDLTEAISLLTDNYRDAERIYPNRKAAELLLARIYLQQGKWALAEQLAETILQSPLYQFQTNINEVFHKSGTHILWQLKPQNSGNATKEAEIYYSTSSPNIYAITQDLVDSFEDVDLRKQSWITRITYNGNTWYRMDKYKNRSGSNTNEYSVILRLEEVYFILAEALAKQNRYSEALPYLNATRVRAGLTAYTSLSGENFSNELLAEKRREFFTEFGHRFIDLKRWNKLSVLSAVKSNWADYKKSWPLPQSELLLNPNLYPQNTGY